MIPTSRLMAIATCAAAAALHLSGLAGLEPAAPVAIAGGQVGGQEAALGTAFVDLAQGSRAVVAPDDLDRLVPLTPTAAQPSPKGPAPEDALQPLGPREPSPAPRAEAHRAALVPVAPPDRPIASTVTRTQRLSARDPDRQILQRSPKPPTRPRAVAHVEPARASPRGNQAEVNARAGQVDGSAPSQGRRSTGTPATTRTGNAAASTYPGLVMQRIQRVRQPSIRAQGAAVVAFRIAANGGVGAVSIAQSSGSPRLDRAAMDVIRRAAPFPQPPQGAKTAFSIQIRAR